MAEHGNMPKLGTGTRFKRLVRILQARKKNKVRNAAALAAFIGRKKFGKKRFQQLAAAGRK